MTKELSRTSALASKHRDLGSSLEDWNGMGTAWTYNSNPNDEHDAIREAAGLIDMSGLKKVHIRGADIEFATAHNIKNVIDKGIGIGAIVELIRSGDVIPKIEKVIVPLYYYRSAYYGINIKIYKNAFVVH